MKYRTLAEAREQLPSMDSPTDDWQGLTDVINTILRIGFDQGVVVALRLIDGGATPDELRAELLKND